MTAATVVTVLVSSPVGAQSPEISIEVSTNGVDADVGPGPTLSPGDAVTWSYRIVVNGPVSLFDLIVSDSSGVVPNCDITGDGVPDGSHIHPGPLDPGQSFTCSATGTVHAAGNGTYGAIGTVKGFDFDGVTQFVDQDATHYTPQVPFVAQPGVTIQSLVNGVDADSSPGPYIAQGSTITWTFIVANTGNVPLNQVKVSGSGGVKVDCGGGSDFVPGALAPGASATCTSTTSAANATQGLQTGSGMVLASPVDPNNGAALGALSAEDASNYTPVELPGALAFTGPTDHLGALGALLLAAGAALWLTSARMTKRHLL